MPDGSRLSVGQFVTATERVDGADRSFDVGVTEAVFCAHMDDRLPI